MAINASIDAIKSSGLSEKDIDLVIVATTTPDQIFPSTACIVQNKLNIIAPAFDIQAACTGFIYAMSGLDGGRLNIAAAALGGAQSALNIAKNYIKLFFCKLYNHCTRK